MCMCLVEKPQLPRKMNACFQTYFYLRQLSFNAGLVSVRFFFFLFLLRKFDSALLGFKGCPGELIYRDEIYSLYMVW